MREHVIVSGELSKMAHKDLYHLSDDLYATISDCLILSLPELPSDISRLHIASTWTDIIRLAVWKDEPAMGDVYLLLKGLGIRPEELLPFSNSDINDLFPWLYYGKRFDILRKVCLTAKTNSEKHLKNSDARVHCHLISEERTCIVASSL
ncbi:MAG: hypothetical protein AABY42_07080 [Nitrospirota bacterium]